MNYQSLGQYTINYMTLRFKTSDGADNELDLSNIFVSVDLYESLFDKTMSGSISIVDSHNLSDVLPMYGGELFEISFETNGTDRPVVYTGAIYKVSEKHRISEHTSGYTLYFTSVETINSTLQATNVAMEDQVSNIVNRIFKKRLNSEKELFSIESNGVHKFVFGNHHPFESIDVLTKYAYSTSSEHAYLFYEDNSKFNFVPVEYLYKQDPVRSLTYKGAGIHKEVEQKVVESFDGIQDIIILEENSYLDRIMDGVHGMTAYRYDMFSKEYKKVEYDKESFFSRDKSLSDLAHKKELEGNYQAVTTMKYNIGMNIPLKNTVNSRMKRIEMETNRVQVSIFGDSTIQCGQVANVKLPNWNVDQSNLKNSVDGDYLMGQIHHQLTSTKYMQTIMLYKDGYSNQ